MHKTSLFEDSGKGDQQVTLTPFLGEANSWTRTRKMSLLVEGTCHHTQPNLQFYKFLYTNIECLLTYHCEHNQTDQRVVCNLNTDEKLAQDVHQQQNAHWRAAYASCRRKADECIDLLHHHLQLADIIYPHLQATQKYIDKYISDMQINHMRNITEAM